VTDPRMHEIVALASVALPRSPTAGELMLMRKLVLPLLDKINDLESDKRRLDWIEQHYTDTDLVLALASHEGAACAADDDGVIAIAYTGKVRDALDMAMKNKADQEAK
jgi:hypothetical protein